MALYRLRPRLGVVALLLLSLSWLPACGSGGGTAAAPAAATTTAPSALATPLPVTTLPLPAGASEAALLDAVYRIDIERIDAAYDLYPAEGRIQSQAGVTFRMRAGQSRPIFHFEPARGTPDSVALRLDGETLDLARPGDARLITFNGSGQVSLELLRDLAPGVVHRLEAAYTLRFSDGAGRFYATVNDLAGVGNEAAMPLLNTPHELARHTLAFRVHAGEPYVFVGSGLVSASRAGDVQQWTLDSEREVASYTMMFHLAPARAYTVEERRLQGVDVRVLAAVGGVSAADAFAQLDPWLAELQTALGPFPMPRGLSIVLTQTGGGMEYFGATTTSLRALRHEVFHMYFGCSTVARTYRDSWWDEAINMWYELSADPTFAPIAADFRSDIVSARTPVTVGFDRRAYDEGARVIQAMAGDLGGRARMVGFLEDLHRRRSFDPFTTWDLADEIAAAGGVNVRERFTRWLYAAPGSAPTAVGSSRYDWLHEVNLAPPATDHRP